MQEGAICAGDDEESHTHGSSQIASHLLQAVSLFHKQLHWSLVAYSLLLKTLYNHVEYPKPDSYQ